MKQLAIFASGSGSNAEAIALHFKNDQKVKVSLIVTNKPDAGVIDRAEKLGIDWSYLDNQDIKDEELLMALLDDARITHIILAGWLQLIPKYLIEAYPNKILNIHPALLPKFGGKGMYGRHVHKAVFESKEKESGITIHLVNEAYDKGEILAQYKVDIFNTDTPESIEAKVRALELTHFASEIERWLR